MGAEVGLVQFRKWAGHHEVNVVTLDPLDVGSAFVFAGKGSFGEGYMLGPDDVSDVVASTYRVRGGAVSWEAWIAARFDGAAFAEISDIYWYMESFDSTGMGTLPSKAAGTYLIPKTTTLVPVSGIYMRSAPCAIELDVSPVPVSGWIPSAAPSWGLPFSDDGWTLFQTGPGSYSTEGDGSDPPEVLNLAPHNSSIPPGENEAFGSGILVSDPEPRYSNIAVISLVVAQDATTGIRNPAIFGLEWTES